MFSSSYILNEKSSLCLVQQINSNESLFSNVILEQWYMYPHFTQMICATICVKRHSLLFRWLVSVKRQTTSQWILHKWSCSPACMKRHRMFHLSAYFDASAYTELNLVMMFKVLMCLWFRSSHLPCQHNWCPRHAYTIFSLEPVDQVTPTHNGMHA